MANTPSAIATTASAAVVGVIVTNNRADTIIEAGITALECNTLLHSPIISTYSFDEDSSFFNLTLTLFPVRDSFSRTELLLCFLLFACLIYICKPIMC